MAQVKKNKNKKTKRSIPVQRINWYTLYNLANKRCLWYFEIFSWCLSSHQFIVCQCLRPTTQTPSLECCNLARLPGTNSMSNVCACVLFFFFKYNYRDCLSTNEMAVSLYSAVNHLSLNRPFSLRWLFPVICQQLSTCPNPSLHTAPN